MNESSGANRAKTIGKRRDGLGTNATSEGELMRVKRKGQRMRREAPDHKAKKTTTVNSALTGNFTFTSGSAQLQSDATGDGRLTYPFTDSGNAELLVRLFGRNIRYCPTLGWLVWDGTRWRRDETGRLSQIAKETARCRHLAADKIADPKLRETARAHARRSESRRAREAIVSLAQSEKGTPVTAHDLDANPYLLNVANGTINLRTGELRQHQREDLITKVVPVVYDPNAKAPLWEAFLNRVFGGNPRLIEFVQRAVGYSLTGDTTEQCLFICYGPGANGKSVFFSVLNALLGEYGQQARSETLMLRRNKGVPNDIAALRGARLVCAIEAEKGERLAEALVKQLTGGDKVRARFLYREEFEFVPSLKLWMAFNHLPSINGADYAMRRRIRLIPFEVTIPEGERDPYLAEKLKGELPGILAWAIRGSEAWAHEGSGEPEEVSAATARYCAEMDELRDFLDNCCEVKGGFTEGASALYKAYEAWCLKSEGWCGETQTAFGRLLTERGFQKKSTNRGVVYLGIRLRQNAQSAECE